MLKKICFLMIAIIFLFPTLTAFLFFNTKSGEIVQDNNLSDSLCDSKSYYTSGGFRDYTDYCEYYFNTSSIQKYINDSECKIVTQEDIENIKSYFENFDEWLKWCDFKDKYTFDKDTQIKEGDYFYIYAPRGHDNYDLYYADMEKCIVYFIHNNT